MDTDFIFIASCVAIGVLCILIFIASIISSIKRKKELDKKLDNLILNSQEISPEEFMELRTAKVHGGKYEAYHSSSRNFAGVYILHNYTNGKYYVGQSKTVLNRVNQHFTGKGNGDVYVDYRNGNEFKIQLIPLENSGFSDLNSLERHFIAYYHAFENGYNKNRGNR